MKSNATCVVSPLRQTVLIVEDEALIAMMLEQMLADAGYRALWSPDGRGEEDDADGVTRLAAAVVDVRLDAGLDGRDVIRRLRRWRPTLPVAVVTAYSLDAPQADLRGLGGPTLRLGKPVNTARLLGWLASAGEPRPPSTHRFHRRLADALRERRPDRS